MKKLLVILAFFSIASFSLIACGSTGSISSGSSSGSAQTGNTVHLTTNQFAQASITLHKGESLTLSNDSGIPHIIANGTWKNGTPQIRREAGAPQVSSVQVAGSSSASIGPFNMSGIFHLYCTIHQDMNLSVVVQ